MELPLLAKPKLLPIHGAKPKLLPSLPNVPGSLGTSRTGFCKHRKAI